jgi:hypothetical protein
VPAVTSLQGEPGAFAPGSLVAVDGDRGAIAVLDPPPDSMSGGLARAGA